MNLLKFRNNKYSQNGEDGVLEFIFQKIKKFLPDQKWCVEFGAWDGKHLSNTFNLVSQGWNAVYIEGDQEKFDDLLLTVKEWPKVRPINKFVSHEKDSKNRLEVLLGKTEIPTDYELLSIDIDSYDLDLWMSYPGSPKVVVIEIDSKILPGIYRWYNGGTKDGNSFSSTLSVAKNKGYELVCHTGNMIFVRNDLVKEIGLDSKFLDYPEKLFIEDWLPKKEKVSFFIKLARMLPSGIKQTIKKFLGNSK